METFTFSAELYRGRNETPVEVEVTYRAVPGRGQTRLHPAEPLTIELVHWDRDDLTNDELDTLEDIAADRADDDLADWSADYGEYLADMRRDRAVDAASVRRAA